MGGMGGMGGIGGIGIGGIGARFGEAAEPPGKLAALAARHSWSSKTPNGCNKLNINL